MTPRAELHLHLYGAVPPRTLLELARRHGVSLPADSVEGLRRWLVFDGFAQFQEAMRLAGRCIADLEALELVTYEVARDLAAQGVTYAEVMVAPAEMEAVGGLRYPHSLEALNRGRERARDDFGIELRWIFELNRALTDPAERALRSDLATEAAIAGRDAGVVALGLSNSEAGHPPEPFAPWFERARAAGLHSVPHAGEHAGPDSVWGAVTALHPTRIAHGVRAIEDPALVAHLAERRIALDVCPTSNVRLGVYPSLADHPLRRLHEAGVPITVNSDDPTMFSTTLTDEISALTGPLGLAPAAADEIVSNALRYALDAGAAA